ncbi:anti-sigma-D factor RsdA [Pseudonocardia xishanensis]|uniref:Anti-sigma-D factor RsdA sigma factor binding region domain-containing protein n=1 Tax=Pseudonocardia xishanensis TaxID=630995 RepID=A0ABP8RUT8_9PSEU
MSDPRNPGGPDHPFGKPRPHGSNGNGRHRNGGSGPHGVPNRPIPFPVGGRPGRVEEDEYADEPLDLVAVQADDELINALSAGMTVSAPGRHGYDADDKVVAMLAAWKAEVDAEPLPQLLDLDTAVAAVESGSPRKVSNRRRHLIPLAGAAALLVFSIAGVSIGAQGADPGDALFPVTQVLYKDAANSKVAAAEVKSKIQQVNAKLASGDAAGAQQDLAALAPLLEQVRPEEGKTYLAAEQTFLQQKAVETPQGVPTDPRAPLRNGTPRPVPPPDVTEGKPDPSGTTSTTPSSTEPDPSSVSTVPGGGPGGGAGGKGPDVNTLRAPGEPSTGAPTSPAPSTSVSPPPGPTTEGAQEGPTGTTTTTTPPPGTTTTSMGPTETTTAESSTTTAS